MSTISQGKAASQSPVTIVVLASSEPDPLFANIGPCGLGRALHGFLEQLRDLEDERPRWERISHIADLSWDEAVRVAGRRDQLDVRVLITERVIDRLRDEATRQAA